jgi:hypothetical protein
MTTTAPARELQRMSRGASWDEASRTARVVLSTDSDVGDGVILPHTREAIDWPSRPLPLVVDHGRTIDRVAGAVTQLQLERIDGRQSLVGRIELDGPAAELVEPLLRTGAARFSVAARVLQLEPGRRGGPDVATRWAPVELSAVVVGQDPAAVLRSNNNTPKEGAMSSTNTAAPAAVQITESTDLQRSAKEIKRERDILRAGQAAGLDTEQTDELIRTGKPINEVHVEIYEILRDRLSHSPAGHPALGRWVEGAKDPLADAIERAFEGKPLERSLIQTLKDAGYVGRSGEEVIRNAFVTGKRSNLIERGFHSTSDAKDLLLSTGDRRLQDRHSEAPRGILELARVRQLSDFREASVIDAGLVGGAVKLNEGAEIRYGSLNSDAGKYKPSRYGLGLSFSFEALANDDLGGISAVLDELSATMLESEATFLGELLFGSAGEGGLCPDGLPLFDVAHGNTPATDATLTTQGLSSMVELLRRQTSIGGRKIWLSPGYILVGPDLETTALQLFSESWNATEPDDTNPWKSLRLIVDPTVEEGYFYLAASGNRKPFEVGRVEGMPQMRQEEDFNTSGMRMKIEHAYGGACVDHRVIVRNKRIPD